MISCAQYDYIEIACLYRYPVKLTIRSGDYVQGIALDTQYNDNRVECIKIKSKDGERLIELDTILTMEACAKNPHFSVVSFT